MGGKKAGSHRGRGKVKKEGREGGKEACRAWRKLRREGGKGREERKL